MERRKIKFSSKANQQLPQLTKLNKTRRNDNQIQVTLTDKVALEYQTYDLKPLNIHSQFHVHD